jgi:hypothetical protein
MTDKHWCHRASGDEAYWSNECLIVDGFASGRGFRRRRRWAAAWMSDGERVAKALGDVQDMTIQSEGLMLTDAAPIGNVA